MAFGVSIMEGSGDSMRCRFLTAASVVVAGAFSASVAFAAGPDAVVVTAAPWLIGKVASDTLGAVRPVGLALEGVTVLPSGEPASSGLPETIAVGSDNAVRIQMAQGRNWDAYGNVFSSGQSLNSAYLGGASTFASARFAVSRDVSLEFSHAELNLAAFDATPADTPTSNLAQRFGVGEQLVGTTSANLNWNFSNWGAFELNAARSAGAGSLLGTVRTLGGMASIADSTTFGISARADFGEGWVTTVAYSEGVTQLDLNRFAGNLAPVRSNSYALGVAKQGLFGDDALGIALSRPLEMYNVANLSSINSTLGQARESDVELGYVTTFLDGTLALQANAAYQMNAAGAKGQTAATGVARAKLNF
jgi:hypothetical protein